MNNDPVVEEIHEARRKLWAECDGTMEGYSRHCEEVAREFRARVAAEVAREQAEGKAQAEAQRVKGAEVEGAMMVCEGEGKGYEAEGEKKDLARKCAEGEG